MIVYSLKCANDHEFEDWFSSSSAFDALSAARKLECPHCQSHDVKKAPMAPSVAKASVSASGVCPVAQSTGQMPSCAGSCACFPD